MRKITLFLMVLLSVIGYGQTTYNATDFAVQDEQFTVSNATAGLSGYDFTLTGANYAWNYNLLTPNTQENILWENPNNSGYKIAWCLTSGFTFNCNTQFNNAFNLATKVSDGIELQSIGLTNIVDHLKLSSSSLENKMIGAAITVSGVSVPFVAQYETPDAIYHFPINYNDNYVSTSALSIDLNSLGVPLQYSSEGQRTNLVEGWGSLTTPYGNFPDVLKMKTTLVTNYTVTTASGSVPTTLTTVSYKWFDPNYGIPVLEVSGDVIAGVWIPGKASYIDNQQCLQPTALFGYLPLVPDYDSISQAVSISFINGSANYDISNWDFGDGNTSTSDNPTHSYTCPGTKLVTLTVTNIFCEPDLIDTITLPIVITDTQNAFTVNVTVADTVLTADRNLSGTTYQWINCDTNVPIADATNQSFTPTENGNYAVELTTNGCQDTSQCYAVSTLANNPFTTNKIVLYPNPTTGIIHTTIDQNEIVKIAIYDIYGRLVSTQLNVENLPIGMYLIKIDTANENYMEKVIKK
ncbi:MAG: PKD domain-containing protein [Flavobacterium sp.]|nr:PKD domain-containing protein [Flavobacterium sp.]